MTLTAIPAPPPTPCHWTHANTTQNDLRHRTPTMWTKIFTIFALATAARCEREIPSYEFTSVEHFPRIERHVSEGVKSLGYKMVYVVDDEFSELNDVVSGMDTPKTLKIHGPRPPIKNLPAADVKCLMSDEHHCTSEMGQMKRVIIQAVKEDCLRCSPDEKVAAGKVIASMMAHNPSAWKLFLTMHLGMKKVERLLG